MEELFAFAILHVEEWFQLSTAAMQLFVGSIRHHLRHRMVVQTKCTKTF